MIKDPEALVEIRFLDWGNEPIRILYVPRALKDVRMLVNIFTESNMVHPDLRASQFYGFGDPWGEERREKLARAKHDWPRRRVYPVETMIPELTEEGKLRVRDGGYHFLHHSLEYRPAEYVKQTGINRWSSFRPPKEV